MDSVIPKRGRWAFRARAAAAAVAAAGVSGCGGPATSPVMFEVRDVQGAPVEGVAIKIVPSNAVHPFRVEDYLRPYADIEASVRTDADGRARSAAYAGRPNRLVVIDPRLGADGVWYADHPLRDGATGWIDLPVGGPTTRLRIRAIPIDG